MTGDSPNTSTPGAAARPLRSRFAWGYLSVIVIGTVIMIAVICTLATLLPKQPAKFSLRTEQRPAAVDLA